MDSDLQQRIERWIDDDIDPNTQQELRDAVAAGNEADLADRMAGPLEFGTAGLRGILGAGPNRMNRAVIIRTAAGLARYLLATDPTVRKRGVVVGHDARRMGRVFAQDTASVLAAHGIKAHLYPDLATTPQVAFATRHLQAAAGVMVTASHNPPEYNGFKVYWDNGAQIIPPHDKGISASIDRVEAARLVPRMPLDQAHDAGLVVDIDEGVTAEYLDSIAALSHHSEGRESLRIVYTAMHGVGCKTAMAALNRRGFRHIHGVAEQIEPDGEFPTVRFPNPEEPGALDLACKLGRETQADLILANDPDADRLAVAAPVADRSRFIQLSGNQVGVLLAHYLLTEDPAPASDRLVVTTIVSSPMLGVIARKLGVRYEETLTGFKWIANRAMQVERETGTRFVFGYEEALGYTIGTAVRDKDGVSAVAVFAELAAYCQSQGRTVLDELERLYRLYGLFVSSQKSLVCKGLDGAQQIRAIMQRLRTTPPASIGADRVLEVRDYLVGQARDADGHVRELSLPSSNVLVFDLENQVRVVARPSGTEPKIKFYFDLCEPVDAKEPFEAAQSRANERLTALETAFLELAQ